MRAIILGSSQAVWTSVEYTVTFNTLSCRKYKTTTMSRQSKQTITRCSPWLSTNHCLQLTRMAKVRRWLKGQNPPWSRIELHCTAWGRESAGQMKMWRLAQPLKSKSRLQTIRSTSRQRLRASKRRNRQSTVLRRMLLANNRQKETSARVYHRKANWWSKITKLITLICPQEDQSLKWIRISHSIIKLSASLRHSQHSILIGAMCLDRVILAKKAKNKTILEWLTMTANFKQLPISLHLAKLISSKLARQFCWIWTTLWASRMESRIWWRLRTQNRIN